MQANANATHFRQAPSASSDPLPRSLQSGNPENCEVIMSFLATVPAQLV